VTNWWASRTWRSSGASAARQAPEDSGHGLVSVGRLEAGPAEHGRAQKREQVYPHLAVPVGQRHRFHDSAEAAGDMDAAAGKDPAAKMQPFGGIVVAWDRQDGDPLPFQPFEEAVEQLHRLHGRDRPVINVSGQQDPAGSLPHGIIRRLGEHLALDRQHGRFQHALAQMQIRQMEQFHAATSFPPGPGRFFSIIPSSVLFRNSGPRRVPDGFPEKNGP